MFSQWVVGGFAQWVSRLCFKLWYKLGCWVHLECSLSINIYNSQLISFNPAFLSSPQWVLRMSTAPSSHSQPHSVESDSSNQAQNANLFNYAQLPNDGLTSGPQLTTDLDGNSSYSAGCKDKTTIPTFSRVVKLGLGSIGRHSLSQTRSEYHVHTPEGHLESIHKVNPSTVTTLNLTWHL